MLHSSDQAFTEMVRNASSWYELARLSECKGRTTLMKQKVDILGLSTSHFTVPRINIKEVNDDAFEVLVRESTSVKKLAIKLGYSSRSCSYHSKLKHRIERIGISTDHFRRKITNNKMSQRNKLEKFDDTSIRTIIRDTSSEQIALEMMGYMVKGHHNTKLRFRRRIASLKIDTSHWKKPPRSQNTDIFVANREAGSITLTRRLIQDFAWPYECHRCKCVGSDWTRVDGVLLWDNEPMTLQVDHINGDHSDNRVENLRFMCANCHTLTSTFCSKNRKEVIKTRKWLHGEPAPESPVGP
jgi:hypothetical protein